MRVWHHSHHAQHAARPHRPALPSAAPPMPYLPCMCMCMCTLPPSGFDTCRAAAPRPCPQPVLGDTPHTSSPSSPDTRRCPGLGRGPRAGRPRQGPRPGTHRGAPPLAAPAWQAVTAVTQDAGVCRCRLHLTPHLARPHPGPAPTACIPSCIPHRKKNHGVLLSDFRAGLVTRPPPRPTKLRLTRQGSRRAFM